MAVSDRATSLVALISTCALAAVVLLMWTAMWHADTRGDRAERRADAAEAQLRHINANCVRNDAGEGQCRSGTFVTTTSTVAK